MFTGTISFMGDMGDIISILEWFRKEWHMIAQAPITFFFLVALLTLLIHLISKRRHAGIMRVWKEKVEVLEWEIEKVKNSKKSVDEITKTWRLILGVYWDEKQTPFCSACKTPLVGTLLGTNVLRCSKCKENVSLIYKTKRYPLADAKKAIKDGELHS